MQASVSHGGKRLIGVFVAALILCSAFFAFGIPEKAEAARTFTVYLQAGHSPAAMGSGAAYNGVKESTLNEQLTVKTYWALKNRGINVQLLNPITLDSSLPSLIKDPPGEHAQYAFYSPEPAMLTAITYPEHFDPAVTEQGDLVLSLHHNAAPTNSTNGYEVYYSSSVGGDYGKDVTAMRRSKQAADLIAASFGRTSLGISPRQPVVRDANNNGITKYSPVPSVLLEMGYMSNAHDFSVMRTSSFQDKTASCIADAVIAYREQCWNPNTSVTLNDFTVRTVTDEPAHFELNASFTADSDVASVRTAVWPVSEGAANAKWYPLTLNASGSYSANISLDDFDRREGTYAFHTYTVDTNGQKENVAQTYEKVELPKPDTAAPTAASITAVQDADKPSSALLKATNVTDASGVASVRFTVTPPNSSEAKSYEGKASGSDWTATIDSSQLGGTAGTYSVRAYGKDTLGNEGLLGAASVTLAAAQGDSTSTGMESTLKYSLVGRSVLALTATDIKDASGVQGVSFAVWGAPDQSDLVWYQGIRSGDDWKTAALLANHSASAEGYNVHAYAMDTAGNQKLIAHTKVSVQIDKDAPTANSVTAAQVSPALPVASLKAENVQDSSGVNGVRFAVWTDKDGQDDLIWYEASQSGDNWIAGFSSARHNSESGPYQIHAYATDGAGNDGFIGSATMEFASARDVQAPTASGIVIEPSESPAGRAADSASGALVTVKDVQDDVGVASVRIALKKAITGSDVCAWFDAIRSGADWKAFFDWSAASDGPGMYVLEARAMDTSGNEAVVATLEVSIDPQLGDLSQILGESQATLEQLETAIKDLGWDDSWYGMSAEDFCILYKQICDAEGVRAEAALAHLLAETDNLKFEGLIDRDQLNFGGIGATGEITSPDDMSPLCAYDDEGRCLGLSFDSLESGVQAQIQYFKNLISEVELKLQPVKEYLEALQLDGILSPEALEEARAELRALYSEKIQPLVDAILNTAA